MMVLEDDSPMEAASSPTTPRNLSAWNITIPYIDFYDDDVKRERIPVFCIDVERNDRKAGEVKGPDLLPSEAGIGSGSLPDVFRYYSVCYTYHCRSATSVYDDWQTSVFEQRRKKMETITAFLK